MYRVAGVLTVVAAALTGCAAFDKKDDNRFAEQPAPIVEPEQETQLAAVPPIPARRPADMSSIIPPEEAYLAKKNIDDLVGLSLEETESLLGGPALEEVQSPARIWSYNGQGCVLSIFFYPRVGGEDYRALAYQVKGASSSAEEGAAAAAESATEAQSETEAEEVTEADRRCFTTLVAQNASSRRVAKDAPEQPSVSAPVE